MDRNKNKSMYSAVFSWVALRKESVDRNRAMFSAFSRSLSVALRKESVDRNLDLAGNVRLGVGSLSARRAWIEIK